MPVNMEKHKYKWLQFSIQKCSCSVNIIMGCSKIISSGKSLLQKHQFIGYIYSNHLCLLTDETQIMQKQIKQKTEGLHTPATYSHINCGKGLVLGGRESMAMRK